MDVTATEGKACKEVGVSGGGGASRRGAMGAGQEGEGCRAQWEGCGGASYGTAGEEKALGLGESKCARS